LTADVVKRMAKRIYQGWFEVWEPEPGVHAIAEPFHSEQVHSYLIEGSKLAILIDTGMGVGDIRAVVEDRTSLPVSVLNSHAHWDHIGGNWRFDQIAIHRAEAEDLGAPPSNARLQQWFTPESLTAPLPDGYEPTTIEIKATRATTLLEGGETLELGDRMLEIIHAPGHSPGGIVVVDHDNKMMFSTDVAYAARLYAFSPDSSVKDYLHTLMTLEPIAARMRTMFPSHGRSPIDPMLIFEMRTAFELILEGRAPDLVEGDRATHQFGEFGVIVPVDPHAAGSRA
jgi:glyoxylase-like metal-dependent hydrolase (beta-lactamase superfamily II)